MSAPIAYSRADVDGAAGGTFRAIGTTNQILCTRPDLLDRAVDLAQSHLREVDRAVSRFRTDSELMRLAGRARRAPAEAFLSPTCAAYLDAGLRAARLTGGLVDPTIGAALVAAGYDDDLDRVRARGEFRQVSIGRVPHWHSVHLNVSARRVSVAAGTLLDLGATAKAHAADTIAAALAESLPGGFLVNLGGDVAVSGELPRGGWSVGVDDADGRTRQVVTSTGQAFATSSTRLRVWQTVDGPRHHIIDPRTGRTATCTWQQVTCAGATCLEANAASTAAIVLGEDAAEWLATQGIPSRLDRADGAVLVTPGWPEPMRRAA
ncbi:FAD:protein FMN transferase [Intrasporangium mesophilum]